MNSLCPERIEREIARIAQQGARYVHEYVLNPTRIGNTEVKAYDNTLVTSVDKACGVYMCSLLEHSFPGVPRRFEDVTGEDSIAAENTPGLFLGDPLDGTTAFAGGLTPTVILAWYSSHSEQVTACAVADAGTDRMWFTRDGQTKSKGLHTPERVLHVSRRVIAANSIVFLDHAKAFQNWRGNTPLTDAQAEKLQSLLNAKYSLLRPGSNGLHQALVAQGNERVAGAITTAIGGPHDVCGVRLVLDAGGEAQGFRVRGKKLVKTNPWNVMEHDILVVGNTRNTVGKLCDAVLEAAK